MKENEKKKIVVRVYDAIKKSLLHSRNRAVPIYWCFEFWFMNILWGNKNIILFIQTANQPDIGVVDRRLHVFRLYRLFFSN